MFVDAENIRLNGGYALRYDVLRRFAARDGGTLLRLNTYLSFDKERADQDPEYARKGYAYQRMVRDFGWKVRVKVLRRYVDEEGNVSAKANADLDLAVDAMLQVENLDQVLLVTGDGDFLQLVTALQNRGCRVELLAFRNVSRQLQREVDAFHNGYLIPDLLPIGYEPRNAWGEVGSCVRGFCQRWFPDKGYGFLSFLGRIDHSLWVTDPRQGDSPWVSVFCHANEVAEEVSVEDLMSRDAVLEFYLQESTQKEEGMVAQNVRLAHNPARPAPAERPQAGGAPAGAGEDPE